MVGRVTAVENRLHNQTHGDRTGFFGLFETVDEQAVADGLLDAAAGWCRQRGLDAMRGPASLSVNDEFGLLVENFTDPPAVMMPYNPPYYADRLRGAGLAPVRDLLVYEVGDKHHGTFTPIPDRIDSTLAKLQQRLKVHIRPLDRSRFAAEVETIKRLYNAAWESNWGFVPMTEREIDDAAAKFRPVVVPEFVPFAEIDGEPVAFALALPDFNAPLRRNRAGRLLPGVARILWTRYVGRFRRIRVLLLGVAAEHRNRGIDALLYRWIWSKVHELQYWSAEAGWILEDNKPMRKGLERIGFRVFRRYRVYERAL